MLDFKLSPKFLKLSSFFCSSNLIIFISKSTFSFIYHFHFAINFSIEFFLISDIVVFSSTIFLWFFISFSLLIFPIFSSSWVFFYLMEYLRVVSRESVTFSWFFVCQVITYCVLRIVSVISSTLGYVLILWRMLMFLSYIPCLSSDHKLHFAFGGSTQFSSLHVCYAGFSLPCTCGVQG